MLLYPLTGFEIQKYYQNKPKLNGAFSRNNLPKINVGAYTINLHEYKSIGTHWTTLHVNGDNGSASYNATIFDCFGVKHIPKKITKFIGNENIIRNIY